MEKSLTRKQRQEALKRLHLLQMEEIIIEGFKNDILFVSEEQGMVFPLSDSNDQLYQLIYDIEDKRDCIIYHVYKSHDKLYFLFVSDNEEEWPYDRDDIELFFMPIINLDLNTGEDFIDIKNVEYISVAGVKLTSIDEEVTPFIQLEIHDGQVIFNGDVNKVEGEGLIFPIVALMLEEIDLNREILDVVDFFITYLHQLDHLYYQGSRYLPEIFKYYNIDTTQIIKFSFGLDRSMEYIPLIDECSFSELFVSLMIFIVRFISQEDYLALIKTVIKMGTNNYEESIEFGPDITSN